MGNRGRGRQRVPNNHNQPREPRGGNKQGPYDLKIGSNDTFNKYYRSQNLVDESEWDQWISTAQSPLPTTFRITSSRSASKAINDHVDQHFVPHLSDVVFEGVQQPPPRKLEWYPGGFAWQLDTAKHVVRKNPEFAKFQQFLVHESDSGNISRQEAVSMIPPLLLDVEPHHIVLDCCAAPGSKTTQLLEALHARSADGSSVAVPPGLLIANDSDAKRCHMLVHQSLNRVGSPNTMITNLDATAIPTLRIPSADGQSTKVLQFDRILCDVPCSGDGTTRKNPNIWKTWKPADGLGLHTLQLRILLRAIQMLKPGGRLVYSTCSYNPVENEAVISAALAACSNMSLVDVPDRLPGLKRRQGLTTWKVFDKYMNQLAGSADYQPRQTKGKSDKPPAETCWPNGKEAENGLDRCLRLYPHLQDTGGFFVAVLQKAAHAERDTAEKANAPVIAAKKVEEAVEMEAGTAESASASTAGQKRAASPSAEEREDVKRVKDEGEGTVPESKPSAEVTRRKVEVEGEEEKGETGTAPESKPSAESDGEGKAKEGAGRPFNEEPYSFLPEDDEQVKTCIDFFGLAQDFPTNGLFVRNSTAQALRSIYLTSPLIRSVIEANEYTKMRLVSCGVKLFARQDSGATGTYSCKWRVLQDGLTVINSYMGPKRKITASLSSLKRMIEDQYPGLDSFEDASFKDEISGLENGSCICTIKPGKEAGGTLETSIDVPLWRAPVSLCLMVEKMEKRALSLRIFGEDFSQADKGKSKKGGQSGQNGKPPAQPDAKVLEQEMDAVEKGAEQQENNKTDGADEAEANEIKGEL